jgi:hypothetical protein
MKTSAIIGIISVAIIIVIIIGVTSNSEMLNLDSNINLDSNLDGESEQVREPINYSVTLQESVGVKDP